MPLQLHARVGESKTNKTEQHHMQQVLQMLHNIQDMVKKLLPSLPTGGDILHEQNVEVPAGGVGGDGGRGGDHGGSGAGGHNQGQEPQQHDEHLKNKNVSEGQDPPPISHFDTLQHCKLVNKFLDLKLPKFMGTEDPSDANEWISKIEKAFDILGQPPEWKVCFSVFLLDGFADQWWDCMKGCDEDSISWERFVSLFKEHFGVNAWKEQKKNEFVDLKQGGMTVSEYHWKFTDLSYFAKSIIPTEEDRLWWFKRGLRPDILMYMAPFPALTLADYADRAARFEIVHNENVRHRDTGSFEQVGCNDKPRSRKKRRYHQAQFDAATSQSVQYMERSFAVSSGQPSLVAEEECLGTAGQAQSRQHVKTCYGCGQPGHIKKNCPFGATTFEDDQFY